MVSSDKVREWYLSQEQPSQMSGLRGGIPLAVRSTSYSAVISVSRTNKTTPWLREYGGRAKADVAEASTLPVMLATIIALALAPARDNVSMQEVLRRYSPP
ncbi:MAG: hypothetical protein Q9180_000443 [Flavoplaca navasiana]